MRSAVPSDNGASHRLLLPVDLGLPLAAWEKTYISEPGLDRYRRPCAWVVSESAKQVASAMTVIEKMLVGHGPVATPGVHISGMRLNACAWCASQANTTMPSGRAAVPTITIRNALRE